MVATKFYSGHDDEAPYVNWAECINGENLLEMELAFLNAINWNIYVSRAEFFEKVTSLEIVLARQQGIKRGFFTYSEMNSVMPSVDDVTQLIQTVIVLGFSYTVFVATMVATVFLVSQIPGTCLHKPTQSTLIQTNIEIPSENSTAQQLISNNSTKTNEMVESGNTFFDYDLTVALNKKSEEFQRKKPNATTWIPMMFSSWYSLLPVISDTFNEEYTACSGLNLTFLSYSSYIEPSKSSIDGMKIHWV